MMNFTKIPNKLLDMELNPYQFSIVIFIARKTIGWGKDVGTISIKQFQNKLNISKTTVFKNLKELEEKSIIVIEKTKDSNRLNQCNSYRINPRLGVVQEMVIHKDTNTKDTITKDTITKDKKRETSLKGDEQLTNDNKNKAINYWNKENRGDLAPTVYIVWDGFTSYWAGNGKKKINWDMAWKTWYVNAIKFNKLPASTNGEKSKKISDNNNDFSRKVLKIYDKNN